MTIGGTAAPRPALPRLTPRVGAGLVVVAGAVFAAGLVSTPSDSLARAIIMALALLGLVAWMAWQDLRTFTIPDAGVVTLAILALAWRWSSAGLAGDPALAIGLAIDAALPGGALLAFREIYFRRRGFDGIGFGDVKLAAAGGLLVGVVGFSWALFAASLLGLAFVGATRLSPESRDKAFSSSDKIAFGALLAPAIWVVWVAQQMPVFG